MNMKKLLCWGILAFCVFSLSAKTAEEVERERAAERQARADRLYKGLDVKRDVVYKKFDGKDVTMDIILPSKKLKGGAPVFINIHGGGWNGGDRYHVGGEWAKKMGELGIAVVTISYTFADKGQTDVSNCAIDCKDALRFLAKNAKKYGLNPNKFFTSGHSAGGHLSLLTALSPNDKFQGAPELKGYDFKIVGAIGMAPVVDLQNEELAPNEDVTSSGNCFGRLMGGGKDKVDELAKLRGQNPYSYLKQNYPNDPRLKLAKEASPVTYLSRNSCPILILQGTKDTLVSCKTARKFEECAKKVGADLTYIEVTNADHGLGGAALLLTDEEKAAGMKKFEHISVSRESQGKIRDMFMLKCFFIDGK